MDLLDFFVIKQKLEELNSRFEIKETDWVQDLPPRENK